MSRTNIIALLIFGAVLGYFLSFGPESTQKFKAGVYRLLAPFLTGGSGIKKQITSVRSGLKSLDELGNSLGYRAPSSFILSLINDFQIPLPNKLTRFSLFNPQSLPSPIFCIFIIIGILDLIVFLFPYY